MYVCPAQKKKDVHRADTNRRGKKIVARTPCLHAADFFPDDNHRSTVHLT